MKDIAIGITTRNRAIIAALNSHQTDLLRES